MAGASGHARRPSYRELEARIVEQDAAIAVLMAENAEMKAQVAELQARLDQSSRNSSRPPSSDGYSKPSPKKRSLRQRSGRKQGGQEGHEGAHLQRVEVPDRVIVYEPDVCEDCGRDLADGEELEGGESRQVFDIPQKLALEVIEHLAKARRCKACGRVNEGRFPKDVIAPTGYGCNLRAFGVYLVIFQHIPYDRARKLIGDLIGAQISTATLCSWVQKAAAGLTEFDEQLRSLLVDEPVVHYDETGLRIAERLGWVHSASTQTLTRYTAHAKRGSEAMDDAGVLPGFHGVAVHDGYSPYRTYTKAIHALCGAHHLRELIAAQEAGQAWASGMGCLLLDSKDAVEEAKAAGLAALSEQALGELHASYRDLIALGYEENPGLAQNAGQKIKRSKAQNLLLRLDKREREATLFAHDFTVPFSNNQAENDIRMVKLAQKISGCFRTMEGAQRYLQVRSYISTARKQGQDTLGVLSALAQGTPWLPTAGET
ncbi:MAG TPA: IS66 family transposase [Solirubrobacteraceae bacterium]|nr:IS66 family transposase [Solirubrobacteraceae bacterium]